MPAISGRRLKPAGVAFVFLWFFVRGRRAAVLASGVFELIGASMFPGIC